MEQEPPGRCDAPVERRPLQFPPQKSQQGSATQKNGRLNQVVTHEGFSCRACSAADGGQRIRAKTQVLHLDPQVLLIKDSQHQFFAKQRWHAGDAKIDLASFDDNPHAPFLGQALLGNVHPANDFDA